MKQRILSLLLALALLCAVLPQIALPARAEDAYSGTCGDNLTWRFDFDTGTLTVEGSGDMYDYEWRGQPWFEIRTDIQKIAFPAGLTSISSGALNTAPHRRQSRTRMGSPSLAMRRSVAAPG